MATITKDDIARIAALSKLKLTDKELVKFQTEVATIVDYFALLEDADCQDLEPTAQVSGLVDQTRSDEVEDYGVSRDQLLKNAVDSTDDGYIKTGKIL